MRKLPRGNLPRLAAVHAVCAHGAVSEGVGGALAGEAEAAAAAAVAAGDKPGGVKGGAHAVLEGLGELWDEAQYAEELSLDAFMAKLK